MANNNVLKRFKRVLLFGRSIYQAGAKYLNSGQINAVSIRAGAVLSCRYQNNGGQSGQRTPEQAGAQSYKSQSGGGYRPKRKAGVALKKIAVQFWQNLFPYQNVLVLKKFLQKFLGKRKRVCI